MQRLASILFLVAVVATFLLAPAWGFQGKTPPATGVTPAPSSVLWSPSPTPTPGITAPPAPTPVVDPSPTPQPQAGGATPQPPIPPKVAPAAKGNEKKAPAKRAMEPQKRKSTPPSARTERSANGHLDVVEGPPRSLTIWIPDGKGGFYLQAKGPIVKNPGDKGKSGENPANPKSPSPTANEDAQWHLLILAVAAMSFLLILARNR